MPAKTVSSRAAVGKPRVGDRSSGGYRLSLQELRHARLYSEELGIALRQREDGEYFKWFLASLLYGGRISETIAANTYRAFERHKLLRPQRIVASGWSYLVDPIMREGGYVRYDGRKSAQILRNCETLLATYDGSLKRLHKAASSSADLESKLQQFHGIGPVTANIFLRELRPYWRKADPEPLPVVVALAAELGIDLEAMDRTSLAFARIEAGLIRNRRRWTNCASRRRTNAGG